MIELLIVIVIIGILSVGLVPKVLDAPKKARDTVRKTDLNNIKLALESYYVDKNSYPSCTGASPCGVETLKDFDSYFQGTKIPVDPSQKVDGKPLSYTYVPFTGCYVLIAKLESNGGNAKNGVSASSCKGVQDFTAGSGDFFYLAGGTY